MGKVEELKKYIAYSNEIKNLEEMESCYEIVSRIDKLKEKQGVIISAINQVKDDKERNVLQQRYLLGRKFEVIADRMNYCVKHIYRIHDSAIKDIDI